MPSASELPTATDLPTLVASAAPGARHAALDPAQLAGTLVVLSIVSRPAYRVRSIYGNPIDGQGLFPERDDLALVDGSRRAMRHLGMLAGAPTPRATVPERFVVLTSEHEGRWYPRVGLEARIEAGQPLGEVRDLLGDVVQEVTATVSGTVQYYVATLAIDRGDPLVGVGATATPD